MRGLQLVVATVMLVSAFSPSFATGEEAAEEAPGFAFSSSHYSVTLDWPDAAGSLLEGGEIFGGTVEAAGRTGSISQIIEKGAWTLLPDERTNDRFFVLAEEAVDDQGDPVLRLDVARTPVGHPVPEVFGEVVLTFQEDAIVHEYEFHLPSGVFANWVLSTTSLDWDPSFAVHGSLHPDGTVVADDGGSLDEYGVWQSDETYGVFQEDPDGLVGHARLERDHLVNYLNDGSFRVSDHSSAVETTFNAFLDLASAGLPSEMRTTDALLFLADGATPETYHAKLLDLASSQQEDVSIPDRYDGTPDGPMPHVVVGVPDSGINPYHEVYHRPNLTVHPCTYIAEFSCDVEALPLSVGGDDWEEMYAQDEALWDSVVPGEWYWIPETVFVAVSCDPGELSICILDDSNMHGTGTTSSVLSENPDALIAFREGGSTTQPFVDAGLPVDIFSVSWGNIVPVPGHPDVFCANHERTPIYVTAAGNDPRSSLVDCRKGDPALITVGGADPDTAEEEAMSAKQPEVVSYYCRPTADTRTATEIRDRYCGTSFSAPTVAGALSKVVLAVRQDSGYTGSIVGHCVDPVAGFTSADLREAMNRTASYDTESSHSGSHTSAGVPLNPVAPWHQWGWGFYDGRVADATIAHVLGHWTVPEKPQEARDHMELQYELKDHLYGPLFGEDALGCEGA